MFITFENESQQKITIDTHNHINHNNKQQWTKNDNDHGNDRQ